MRGRYSDGSTGRRFGAERRRADRGATASSARLGGACDNLCGRRYGQCDQLDRRFGRAGGVSFVALLWLAVAAVLLGKPFETLLILVFAFGILGFLAFNFRLPWRTRAAGFLGDAGSMMLGLGLSYAAISLTQTGGHDLPPTSALWICALPIIDTLSVLVRRFAAGKSIGSPDSRHLHELL